MDGELASFVGGAIVVLIVVVFIAVVVGAIVTSMRKAAKRNAAFLANPLAAAELPASVPIAVPFSPAPGMPHAVWLDLTIVGPALSFELWLAVRVGNAVLIEGTYPVTIDDDEGDVRGLPNAMGTTALNTTHKKLLGNQNMSSVLRAFRFDAPPAPAPAEVRARIVPGPGVSLPRSRLLVTVKDSPH